MHEPPGSLLQHNWEDIILDIFLISHILFDSVVSTLSVDMFGIDVLWKFLPYLEKQLVDLLMVIVYICVFFLIFFKSQDARCFGVLIMKCHCTRFSISHLI